MAHLFPDPPFEQRAENSAEAQWLYRLRLCHARRVVVDPLQFDDNPQQDQRVLNLLGKFFLRINGAKCHHV